VPWYVPAPLLLLPLLLLLLSCHDAAGCYRLLAGALRVEQAGTALVMLLLLLMAAAAKLADLLAQQVVLLPDLLQLQLLVLVLCLHLPWKRPCVGLAHRLGDLPRSD
jgi:hypothetical protein